LEAFLPFLGVESDLRAKSPYALFSPNTSEKILTLVQVFDNKNSWVVTTLEGPCAGVVSYTLGAYMVFI